MKTLKKINLNIEHVEFIPEELKENTIYISNQYKTSVHLCLCGCGNKSVIPMYNNWWTFIENEKGLSITPSILNTNCPNKYHYIITNSIANIV